MRKKTRPRRIPKKTSWAVYLVLLEKVNKRVGRSEYPERRL